MLVWLYVVVAALLHVEEPENMVTPISLFIDGFGIMHAPVALPLPELKH